MYLKFTDAIIKYAGFAFNFTLGLKECNMPHHKDIQNATKIL